jgi:hypothetical protein
MATKQLYSANLFHRMSFGDFGLRYLDSGNGNTSPSGERYCYIESLDNTTISFTNNTPGGDTTVTDLVLKDFHNIRGDFSDITVTHGKCIAYLRN